MGDDRDDDESRRPRAWRLRVSRPSVKRPRAPRFRRPDDDLLAGFGRAGRPAELRAFFATTIAASLLAWDLTFQLGAYHTVFYSRLFQILVVSIVLLAGSLALHRDMSVRPWMYVVLVIPLLWLFARLGTSLGHSSTATHVVDGVLIGLTVASLPFIGWAVAHILVPDYFELPARRLKALAIMIVVLVAVAGFIVGQFNYRFTTCHDYVVAGDNTPTDCAHSRGPAPHR